MAHSRLTPDLVDVLRRAEEAVIAAWLGHADASFTMRTYVHSQDD